MMLQAGNAVAAWIYLWMTFQLSFYESTDLLRRVSFFGRARFARGIAPPSNRFSGSTYSRNAMISSCVYVMVSRCR